MLRCPTDKLLNCQDSEAIKYFDLDNMFLFFCSETSNFRSDFAVVQAYNIGPVQTYIESPYYCLHTMYVQRRESIGMEVQLVAFRFRIKMKSCKYYFFCNFR
jgi:hypothetical protein